MKAGHVRTMISCVGRKKFAKVEVAFVRPVTRNAGGIVTRPVLTGLCVTPFPAIVCVNRKIVPSMLHGTVQHVYVCVKMVMKCAMECVTWCVTVPG